MPYYIFRMSSQEGMDLVKNLELMAEFDTFKEAKAYAREQRTGLDGEGKASIKMMFELRFWSLTDHLNSPRRTVSVAKFAYSTSLHVPDRSSPKALKTSPFFKRIL